MNTETMPTLDEVTKTFPRPWGQITNIQGEEACFRLNARGMHALTAILLQHDGCVDSAKADACMTSGDQKGVYRELAAGAKKFVEEHREAEQSCVPGLPIEALIAFMDAYVGLCGYLAGIADEYGEPLN